MKKITAVLLAVVFIFALSACDNKIIPNVQGRQAVNNQAATDSLESKVEVITRERAIELALANAGFNRDDVRELEAELDRERKDVYWEVDFEYQNTEYSYDVNAQTEQITKLEKERD